MSENIYKKYDDEILSVLPAIEFAEKNLNNIIDNAYEKTVKKVFTTQGYDLGIASPDIINHRVVGGSKRGHIIKKPAKNGEYCIIGYDKNEKPLYFKDINSFGTEFTYFFFDFAGFTWAIQLESFDSVKKEISREVWKSDIIKFRCDKNGRVLYFAKINAPSTISEYITNASIILNEYEYPGQTEKPIICHKYRYTVNLSPKRDDISIGGYKPGFYERLYEISPDLETIREYYKEDNKFTFGREIVSSKKRSSKPKTAVKENIRKEIIPTGNNLYERFDDEILSVIPAMEFAGENIDKIIDSAYANTVKKVYTTLGYDLGIACPDPIIHRIIGGNKKGRVIKKIPENTEIYCEVGYDKDEKPLYFKHINSFGSKDTYFFFEYDGCGWAMQLESVYLKDNKAKSSRKVSRSKIKKFRFDEKNRIIFYASIDAPEQNKHSAVIKPDASERLKKMMSDYSKTAFQGSIIANEYEYPENSGEPVICNFYYYVPGRSGSDKSIPAGFEGSPMSESRYEISPDWQTIHEYRKIGDDYEYAREIISSKGWANSSKPKADPDSFKKLSKWLDAELEKDIPGNGGIYFDLFEPSEDGFGIYFCVTKDFTPDDDEWACDVEYSSDNMFTVSTNGALEWEKALGTAARLLKKYLKEGAHRDILKKYKGAGVSFPDGDITYLKLK